MKPHHAESLDSGFATRCAHAGTNLDKATGGARSPVFTSTAYAFPNPANANVYPRYFNTLPASTIPASPRIRTTRWRNASCADSAGCYPSS